MNSNLPRLTGVLLPLNREGDNIPKFFDSEQLACKCGCGLNNPSYGLINIIDKTIELCDIPIYINSACRCEKHNKKVGGSQTSSHLPRKDNHECEAVDFDADTSKERYKVLKAMMITGFKRIGIGKTFLHGDISHDKVQNIVWRY